MTREEAIKILSKDTSMETVNGLIYYAGFNKEKVVEKIQEAMEMGAKALEMEKTTKFDRMIEAFECDFALIENGDKTFAELDRMVEDSRYSLSEHMCLMQELSYLIRHGKAEIYVKEGET